MSANHNALIIDIATNQSSLLPLLSRHLHFYLDHHLVPVGEPVQTHWIPMLSNITGMQLFKKDTPRLGFFPKRQWLDTYVDSGGLPVLYVMPTILRSRYYRAI